MRREPVLDSIVRSIVMLVVSLLLGWAARVGLNIPSQALTIVVTAIIGAVFYTLVRVAERRWPIIGQVLLGLGLVRRTPIYIKPGTRLVPRRPGQWPPGREPPLR